MYTVKKGFTLAEVLITLLIIGVIASIVIPGLISDTQDAEYKVAWKKAYGELLNAYKLSIQDNGGGFGAYKFNSGISPKYLAIKSKMSVIKDCNGNSLGNCWNKTPVTPDMNTASCPLFGLTSQNNNYSFVTSNGMFIMLYGNLAENSDLIAIDVNGAKGPNQWNKDVQVLVIDNINFNIQSACTLIDGTTIRNNRNYLQ